MAVIRYLPNNNIKSMGLDNKEGGKYITIYQGKFSIRVPEGTPGAASRVNKMGKTVFEKYYDSFTAKLVNIRTRDSQQYGKSWEFDFRDEGETYTLQLSFSNSFAKSLIKILPNADLTKEMKLQPSTKKEGEKTKSSLFVSQDGVTLKHAYTKDNPNGMPDMEQIMVKGQPTWDDTKQLEFLHAMVKATILPNLPKDMTVPKEALAIEETEESSDDANDF